MKCLQNLYSIQNFPQWYQDFILGNWVVCGNSQKLFNAKMCDPEEWTNWTGNNNTFFFFFFGSRQGVAPNYEIDFLVWCTMKSEVNSQKEIESTGFWANLILLAKVCKAPFWGYIGFCRSSGSKWYTIWGKLCMWQKVLPSKSEKTKLDRKKRSYYLLAVQFKDDSKSLGGWGVIGQARECRRQLSGNTHPSRQEGRGAGRSCFPVARVASATGNLYPAQNDTTVAWHVYKHLLHANPCALFFKVPPVLYVYTSPH